ncbi:hypothetical protein ACFLVW_05875 [Chloroflexota bacterium]
MGEEKERVILLGSEGCGTGDADLGFEILATLLETLPKREDRPAAIICWNTAVKLLAEGSPLLPKLKRLEENGVSILAGKLCVEDLDLTDKISVGKVATLGEILDLILHNDVVSL